MSRLKTLLPALLLASMAAPQAQASGQEKLKSISFKVTSAYNQVIHITSTDKKKWNKIKPGSVQFHAAIDIVGKLAPLTSVDWLGVHLGGCGTACANELLLYQRAFFPRKRKVGIGKNITVFTAKIDVSKPGFIAINPTGDAMINRCNQHLSANGPTKQYSFNFPIPVTLAVRTAGFPNDNKTGIDFSKNGAFLVKVVCDPVIKPTTDGFAAAEPNFKVKDVKMFLSTFSHATTKPNKATVCKKGRVLVRIATSKKGPVKFRLWTKTGNQPMQNQVIEAWSSHQGPGIYFAQYKKWVTTSKNATLKAMVEDMTNPIGQSSGWKNLKLNCTGAGGGGLADKPNTSDPDNNIPDKSLKITGKLSLSAKRSSTKHKSRRIKVFYRIWANKKGSTSYHLNCGKNRIWQGSLATTRVKGGKYRAFGTRSFVINKSERVACALRSKSLPKKPVIAIASKQFIVVKRNPNISGKGGLTAAPRSTHRSKPMRTKRVMRKSATRKRRTKPAKVKKSKILPQLLRKSRQGLRNAR